MAEQLAMQPESEPGATKPAVDSGRYEEAAAAGGKEGEAEGEEEEESSETVDSTASDANRNDTKPEEGACARRPNVRTLIKHDFDLKRDSVLSPQLPTPCDSKTALSPDTASIDTHHSIPSIVINGESEAPATRNGGNNNKDNNNNNNNNNNSTTSNEMRVRPRKRASTVVPSRVDSKLGDVPAVPRLPRGDNNSNTNNSAKESPVESSHSIKVVDNARPRPVNASANATPTTKRQSVVSVADSCSHSLAPSTGVMFRQARSTQSLRTRPSSTATSRPLSFDEELLSQRLRLMYEKGDSDVSDTEINEVMNQQGTPREDHGASPGIGQAITTYEAERPDSAAPSATSSVRRRNTVRKEQEELAGGIEDWKGIRVGDVDRYGFIHETRNAPVQSIQRVSTSLLLASTSPRSRRRLSRNSFASTNAPNTPSSPGIHRTTSRTPSLAFARPLSSQSGYRLPFTKDRSGIRYPRRARKCINEAADMLTLPRADVEDENSPYAMAMKRREWRREDKWQRMAEVCKSQRGGGMTFRFDMKSSKLIERTWKGIPDRWRAVAWHSFLSQSAERRKDCQSDEELTQLFHELQEVSSADDVQIDLDVPRTISSHIMFRRRYRGGQRLLFRVLHAMSLHFPQTGYVQGMAALAATLLAYYDEEQAFIMLVRLWQVRGLDRLYRSGFAGLMEALDDFERHWLCGGEIAEKLNALGIPPTSYGTRWYLTLFNYAIPFPAQLRVWDVFMLLGDSGGPDDHATNSAHGDNPSPFGNSLDVLHAVSASLIDGMRDIILQSDFENAMKVLTSWVPIKDVELFMRVAKVEYKVHANKARESALHLRGR